MPFIADQTAVCFDSDPELTLIDRNTLRPIPDDDPRSGAWKAVQNETNLLEIFDPAETWSFLHEVAFVQGARRNREVMWDVLLADEVEAEESPVSARRLDWAPVIYVGNAQPLRTSEGPKQTTYTMWTRDVNEEDPNATPKWHSHQVSDRGQFLPNPTFADDVNPYNRHPIYGWYESYNRTGVYPPPKTTLLLQAQEVAILRWVLFHEAINFHSLGRLCIFGQDEGDLPSGPRDVLRLTGGREDVDAKYLNVASNIPGVWEVLVGWIQFLCMTWNIPGPSLNPKTPSIETGEAVRQRRIGLGEVRKARAARQKKNLIGCFDNLVVPVWDHWQPDEKRRLGPNVTLRVVLGDSDLEAATDQSQAQGQDMEMDQGVVDPVEIRLRREGVTGKATDAEWEEARTRVFATRRRRAALKAMDTEEQELARLRAQYRFEQWKAKQPPGEQS